MSETETEQEQAPDEAPPETDVPLEEPEPDEEAAEAATSEPGSEQEQSETDAEIEALYVKLETKAKNYAKGMGELLEDRGVPVAICEMCADAFPGIRWTQPRDDMHAAMLGLIGAAGGESPLLDDPDALLCDRCNGFGWTRLPSHVTGNTERLCRQCNGAGWLDRSRGSGAPIAPVPEPVNGPAEALPGVPEDDPSVIDLRARGFTVIPPMTIGAVAEQ